MEYILQLMAIKMAIIIPLAFGIVYLLDKKVNKDDKTDKSYDGDDVKGDAIATAIYKGAKVVSLYLFFAIVFGLALVAIML